MTENNTPLSIHERLDALEALLGSSDVGEKIAKGMENIRIELEQATANAKAMPDDGFRLTRAEFEAAMIQNQKSFGEAIEEIRARLKLLETPTAL